MSEILSAEELADEIAAIRRAPSHLPGNVRRVLDSYEELLAEIARHHADFERWEQMAANGQARAAAAEARLADIEVDRDQARGMLTDESDYADSLKADVVAAEARAERAEAALRQIRDRRRGDGLPLNVDIARAVLGES